MLKAKLTDEIAIILGNNESTVKKHVLAVFEKLGLRNTDRSQLARAGSAQFRSSSKIALIQSLRDRLKGFEAFHPELRLTVAAGFGTDPERRMLRSGSFVPFT